MEKLKKYIGFKLAVFYFAVGTSLFLSYLIYNNSTILMIGYFYVLTAIISNLILEAVFLIQLLSKKEDQYKIMANMAILLVNIPIAILYFFIVLEITF